MSYKFDTATTARTSTGRYKALPEEDRAMAVPSIGINSKS